MPLTASRLRADIYRILDEILETGVPVDIERKGKMLRIVPVEPPSKLDNLRPRPYVVGDAEELVHLDWSAEWDADAALPPETTPQAEDDGGNGGPR